MATVSIPPKRTARISFGVRGTSPLIMHKWSDKAIKMIVDKGAGKKTKNRDVRNPEQEAKDATYVTKDGDIGILITALKKSMIGAAHKDLGIEKTLVKKAVFFECEDPGLIVPIEFEETEMRADMVKVGPGSADIRYRPEFRGWSAKVTAIIDLDLLQPKDVLTLVDRAGFGQGLCEWRPEKGGEYGRYEIDTTVPLEVVNIESEQVEEEELVAAGVA
jgi:hypothetical protein